MCPVVLGYGFSTSISGGSESAQTEPDLGLMKTQGMEAGKREGWALKGELLGWEVS